MPLDLTERLRRAASNSASTVERDMKIDAADEIERLQEENLRLRAALRPLAYLPLDQGIGAENALMIQMARSALGQS